MVPRAHHRGPARSRETRGVRSGASTRRTGLGIFDSAPTHSRHRLDRRLPAQACVRRLQQWRHRASAVRDANRCVDAMPGRTAPTADRAVLQRCFEDLEVFAACRAGDDSRHQRRKEVRRGHEAIGLASRPSGGATPLWPVSIRCRTAPSPSEPSLPHGSCRVPQQLGREGAAAFGAVGATAWQAVFEAARITPATKLLVTGGAGSVGEIAVQLACSIGARVFATMLQGCSGLGGKRSMFG
jgi:hypothetical protein